MNSNGDNDVGGDKTVRRGRAVLAGRTKVRLVNELNGEQQKKVKHTVELGQTQRKEIHAVQEKWLQYYKSKRIHHVLSEALQELLGSPELPENPFILLSNKLRMSELSFGLFHDKDVDIIAKHMNDLDEPDPSTRVTNVRGCTKIWGLPHLLRVVDVQALEELLGALKASGNLLVTGQATQGEYKTHILTALIGTAVFHGYLVPYLPLPIQICSHIVIDGPKFEKAVNLYANLIIKDAVEIDSRENAIFEAVNVTTNSSAESKAWALPKIKSSKSSFVSAIKAATVAKRKVSLGFILRLSCKEQRENCGVYVRIEKEYVMHFRQIKDGTALGPARSFTDRPLRSLTTGIFTNRSDAILYSRLFQSTRGDCLAVDSEEVRINKEDLKAELIDGYLAGDLLRVGEVLLPLCALAGLFSTCNDILRLLRSSAGKLRGLRNENQVMQDVLQAQRKDITRHRQLDHKVELGHLDAIVVHFGALRKKLLDIILVNESSEIIALRKCLQYELFDMCDSVNRRLILTPNTVTRFRFISDCSRALELTIGRDLITLLANPDNLCPKGRLETIVSLIEVVFTERFQREEDEDSPNKGRQKGKQSRNQGKPKLQGRDEASKLAVSAARSEYEAAKRAHQSQLVISLEAEMKRSIKLQRYPAQIVREAILMQYVGDTRIDVCFQSLNFEIFTNGRLLPNPYPIVVEKCRAEAARHALWREPDSDLLRLVEVPSSNLMLVNQRAYVYTIQPSTQKEDGGNLERFALHGSRAALQLCHEKTIKAVLEQIKDVFCSNKLARTFADGPSSQSYVMTICAAVGGDLQLYSRIHRWSKAKDALESVHAITVYEEYVVEGPTLQGALELFSNTLVKHSIHLHDKTQHLVIGIHTGKEAMDLLNSDSGNEGGWAPAPHHHNMESSTYYSVFHPHYHRGATFTSTVLRRDPEKVMREVHRAMKVKEPVVVLAALLAENDAYIVIQKQVALHHVQVPSGIVDSHCPGFNQFDRLFKGVWLNEEQAVSALECINSANDPQHGRRHAADPDDPRSWVNINYSESLKHKCVRAFNRGDMITAYKALLRFAILRENNEIIPDLIRMLKRNTVAQELGMLVAANDSIRALLSQRHENEDFRNQINIKVLKHEFERYRSNVENTLSRPDCIFFPGIRNAIHMLLLQTCNTIERDRSGNAIEHIQHLQQLHTYLECIRMSASYSVHLNAPQIDKLLRLYQNEEPSQPKP